MMDPNVFDLILAAILFSSVLGGCLRGLGQEMFHTIVFGLAIAAGYVVFKTPVGVQTPDIATAWFVNTGYFVLTAYVLAWAVMHSVGHVFIGHAHGPLEIRTRIWGGALNMLKIAIVIGGLSMWYALHTPLPQGDRLGTLPKLMREGLLTAFVDRNVDGWADALIESHLIDRPVVPEALKGMARPAPEPTPAEAARAEQAAALAPMQPAPEAPAVQALVAEPVAPEQTIPAAQ